MGLPDLRIGFIVEHFQKSGNCFDLIMVLKSGVTRDDSRPGQELKTNVGMGSELEQLNDARELFFNHRNFDCHTCRNTCGFSHIGMNVALLVWYTELSSN